MIPLKQAAPPRFVVEVVFSNAGTVYGIETCAVEAADRAEARGIALRRSEDSPYDDARIPDRRRSVRVRRSVTTTR
ncbi:hypothetical protein [Azospirillum sp. B506]|uniref:hypothetical protein n=1 Tax=Azospirillum sp. B506 TaxID=137721 RepID=UPI0005B2DF6A|nr:hypothetical protein [Azospirillum sp. B506]